MTTTLVRVRLDNGMEASVPEDHAKNADLKILKDKDAVDGMGNALPATGEEVALERRAAKASKKTAAKKTAAPAAKKTAAPAAPTENV